MPAAKKKYPLKGTPEYKIWAMANLDIKEHMAERPWVVDDPGKVKWDVEYDNGKYIASGKIKIPVTMVFVQDPDGEEGELIKDHVEISGQCVYDSRGNIMDDLDFYDPIHGVDPIRVVANARFLAKKKGKK